MFKQLIRDFSKGDTNTIEISVDRTSVHPGDDMSPHIELLKVQEKITTGDLIHLLDKGYIPSIQGNNVVWGLEHDRREIAVYYTKSGEITNPKQKLKELIDQTGNNQFYFRYYGTPEGYLRVKGGKK